VTATYIAKDGRVYVRYDGALREVNSAVTLNESDIAQFDRASAEALRQRQENAAQLSSLTGVVPPIEAA
jgi:hypothetical protein